MFILRRRHSMDEWDNVKMGGRRSILTPCHSMLSSLGPPEVCGVNLNFILMSPKYRQKDLTTSLCASLLRLCCLFYLLLTLYEPLIGGGWR